MGGGDGANRGSIVSPRPLVTVTFNPPCGGVKKCPDLWGGGRREGDSWASHIYPEWLSGSLGARGSTGTAQSCFCVCVLSALGGVVAVPAIIFFCVRWDLLGLGNWCCDHILYFYVITPNWVSHYKCLTAAYHMPGFFFETNQTVPPR